MKRSLFVFALTLFSLPALAEWNIEGKVLEKGTRAPMQGVSVSVQGRDGAAVTDALGVFHLVLPAAGSYELSATLAGSSAATSIDIVEGAALPVPVIYLRLPETLGELVVTAPRAPERVSKSVIGGKTLRQLPGSSGDPLRGLQSLPGVVTVNGSSAPAVRGSGPGDNAYYVDSLNAGKLFHYGAISVFNADLIEDFNLYGAAFGPHYGNVTGAVIDVALREPRRDRLGGKMNVNLMGADFLVEGPRNQDQAFYFAARRSYIDLLVKEVESDGVTVQIPNYWDYQGKYLWQVNEDNKLTFHLLGAGDSLELNVATSSETAQMEPVLAGDSSMSDSNSMQGVVLDSILSGAAVNKLILERTDRRSNSSIGTAGTLTFTQENLLLRDQVRMELSAGHELSLGAEFIRAAIQIDADYAHAPCTQFEPDCDLSSAPRVQLSDRFTSHAWALSVQDRKRVLDHLTLIGGVRRSAEDYLHRSYIEPRVGMEWEWSKDTLLTAGWGRHNQMPTGEQVVRQFGNPGLGHIRADHTVLGIAQKVNEDWNWKTEAYYKKLSNLVISDPLLNYINAASGKAYGLELLIKKEETDKLSGWWVLNLTKSQRRNDVTGESFRFQYDQPVNTTLVGKYKLSEAWSFGMKWNYHSGTPWTPIVGTNGTYADGRPIPVYAGVNSDTLPVYHRLDLRVDRNYVFDRWKLNTYFELNNVYQRKNIVGYSYDPTYTTRDPVESFVLPFSFGVQGAF
ncbi:MAG: TonB-dependent receptor [Gammaproteobacteria bacterium]|nr:TonB-dependent receptor [Gammaproteobacteria bacterium]MBU1969627.1 TonB-dependent receptor [Gammaproteobacteria bacterium]